MKQITFNPLTNWNLKYQIILIFLTMVIPLLFLHWYGNVQAEAILKRHVTTAYAEMNALNHILIDRDINTIDKITVTIIQDSVTQALIPSKTDHVYERLQKENEMFNLLSAYSLEADNGAGLYYSLYIYDPNDYYFFAPKTQVQNTGVYFFSDANKPEWFDEAISKKGKGYLKIIQNNSYFNHNDTLSYIRAVKSIYRNHDVIGVLVVTNVEQKVRESMKAVSLPDDGEIYLVNNNNQVLASTQGAIGSILKLPSNFQRHNSSRTMEYAMTEDTIYVINQNEISDQKLIYKIPMDTLLQQQSELKQVIGLISFFYVLLVLLLFIYFWKSLMTPIQKLVKFIRWYEPGKTVVIPPPSKRTDEVGVLMSSMYEMALRLNTLFQYKYQAEIRQKEAQLQILYQQINPHLLYNTLESIYWKSSLEGKTESSEMIKELSKLMKIALSRGKELITLEEELEHAKAYVSLQKIRYDYSFTVHWNISKELYHVLIPKITLQPLIENAIIHGVKNMGEDGMITISARLREEDVVMVEITDNGFKPADLEAMHRLLYGNESNPSLGYGIRNIHQRIQLHYGQGYGLSYRAIPEGGTVAILIFPKNRPADSHYKA
ncbi:cache domain-containing sensor histidine kinase [Paenibacillus jiagnxiensis]|uniref:cache domain-containing sensor histidine kinase n=1 Tax=Paenibacillus jiagnxiensis TaxID=3228926 RepID=UPI0033B99601